VDQQVEGVEIGVEQGVSGEQLGGVRVVQMCRPALFGVLDFGLVRATYLTFRTSR